MKFALHTGALLVVAAASLAGAPEQLSLLPASANAVQLICSSTNYQYSYCHSTVDGARVVIADQLSRAPCVERQSWGYDPRGIWVDRGCAARFAYRSRPTSGDVAGAAVVGGLIGVLLGAGDNHRSHSQNDYYDRSPTYSRPYPVIVERRRDTSQDVDRSVQKFDKDGNPNYDANGAYQGAHGVGALVDNPDAPSSGDGGPDR